MGPAGNGCAGLFRRVLKIIIHANPVHLTAPRHLLPADDRNIIFRLAGDGTHVATNTSAKVDYHAPGMAFVFDRRIQRLPRRGRRPFSFTDGPGILLKVRESSVANEAAAFHALMLLRGRQQLFSICLYNLQAGPAPRCIRSAQGICIKSDVVTGAPRAFSSVTQMHRNAIIPLPCQNPNRRSHGTPAIFKFDYLSIGKLQSPGGRH